MQFKAPSSCKLFVACVEDAQRANVFALIQKCRDAGIACDMSHQARSLKSQFKLANKLEAEYIITLGPDEVAKGTATLRNMATHDEREVDLSMVHEVLR